MWNITKKNNPWFYHTFFGLIKDTFSLWSITNMSMIGNKHYWHWWSKEITFQTVHSNKFLHLFSKNVPYDTVFLFLHCSETASQYFLYRHCWLHGIRHLRIIFLDSDPYYSRDPGSGLVERLLVHIQINPKIWHKKHSLLL